MSTLTPSTAKQILPIIMQSGLVANITGSPGVGKSDIVKHLANQFNLKLIDMRLSQMDPTDLNGFPTFDKNANRSHYAPPATIPLSSDPLPDNKDGWLLFFDEMNSASNAVQAATYKVILDRQIGEHDIHSNVVMMCAGNKATDRAIVNRLSTAMQSRLIHFTLETNIEDWSQWAVAEKIDPRIVSFLNFKPDLLHKFKSDHADDTFPCPRTWEFAHKLLKQLPPTMSTDHFLILKGTVGEGAASEFVGFCDVYGKLPNFADIIADPLGIPVPTEPDIQYAITALLGDKGDTSTIAPISQFLMRLPIEFQVITFRYLIEKDKKLMTHPSVINWVKANAQRLAGTP